MHNDLFRVLFKKCSPAEINNHIIRLDFRLDLLTINKLFLKIEVPDQMDLINTLNVSTKKCFDDNNQFLGYDELRNWLKNINNKQIEAQAKGFFLV